MKRISTLQDRLAQARMAALLAAAREFEARSPWVSDGSMRTKRLSYRTIADELHRMAQEGQDDD